MDLEINERDQLLGLTNLIININYSNFVKECICNFPNYFWEIPASSSGKYHPYISLGKGGLVRHTILSVTYALLLIEKNNISPVISDKIIIALILHDSCKAGLNDEKDLSKYNNHENFPRIKFKEICDKYESVDSNFIFDLIESHMGEWSINKIPDCFESKLVHYADYLASRKNQPVIDFFNEIKNLKTFDETIKL